MKSSPRKGKQYHVRIPVSEAAEIVGGNAALERLAEKKETLKTWKKTVDKGGGVPIFRLAPTLLGWWRAQNNLIQEAKRRGREELLLEIDALRGETPLLSPITPASKQSAS